MQAWDSALCGIYLYDDLEIKALPDSSSSFLLFFLPQNLEKKLPLFFSSTFFFFFLNAAASYDAKLKVNSYIFEKRPSGSFCLLFPGQVEIWNIGFCMERKTGGLG